MIAWLWDMLIGQFCKHQWETIMSGSIVNDDDQRIAQYYNLRCTKCGNIKYKRC